MYTPESNQLNHQQSVNKGGPLHYMGNRNLTWPNREGRMTVEDSALQLSFSVIFANQKSKKFRRCYEPFSGCASWSLAAMELNLADEYIINDSDEALINTLRLIKNSPGHIKSVYKSLVEKFSQAEDKKDFFLAVIRNYNEAKTLDEKSLMLPFIINHTWAGMIFHDEKGNIIYKDMKVKGKDIRQGYLEVASISLDDFSAEVDKASHLLNTKKVTLKSGDFLDALSDMQEGDFVSLNPPYPETRRVRSENSGLYTELYDEKMLHQKLVKIVERMEKANIGYHMNYGCYEKEMDEFVIKDESNRLRHFFRIIGGEESMFGASLDQIYFSSRYVMPSNMSVKLISAETVLDSKKLTSAEALVNFKNAMERQAREDQKAQPVSAKKHVIFLSKLFRIRADLGRVKAQDTAFYLLASDEVLNRMDKNQLAHFSAVSKTSFEQSDLESQVSNLIHEKKLDISSILIITNDEAAIIPAAKLREKFGIKGSRVEVAELFIDKIKMKQRVAERGVRIPRYVFFNPSDYLKDKEGYISSIFRQFDSEIVFAKPIDSFGSNNVSKLSTKSELMDWCENHLSTMNYELDEYLTGELFHLDSVVVGGKIVDAQSYKYAYPLAEVSGGKSFGVRLMSPSENDYHQLMEFNTQVLKALEPLPDGVTHLEVFKTPKNELVFLEIACRPSGGLTPELSELYSGVNYEAAHYLAQMNLPMEGFIPPEHRKTFAAFIFYPKTPGEVTSLSKQPDLQTVTEFKYSVKPGDNINAAQHLMDSVATAFMKSEDAALLKREFEFACTLKPVTVYPRELVMRAASMRQDVVESQNSESTSKSSLRQSK